MKKKIGKHICECPNSIPAKTLFLGREVCINCLGLFPVCNEILFDAPTKEDEKCPDPTTSAGTTEDQQELSVFFANKPLESQTTTKIQTIFPEVLQVSQTTKPIFGLAAQLQASIQQVQGSNLETQALAGTGKTTMNIQGLVYVRGLKPSIEPSDQQAAVWEQFKLGKSDSVRMSAFNASITDEMTAKIKQTGLDKLGVEARGIHSLGLYSVTKAFGRYKAEGGATYAYIKQLAGDDWKTFPRQARSAVNDLVSKCKQTLTEPTPENLAKIASRYDVDIGADGRKIYDMVPKILELAKDPSNHPQRLISFDDMLWLPLVHNLPIYKVDFQIVDESQDLNRAQQELMYRAGHRIAYVGDRNQAIYGFAGADAESMDRMNATLLNWANGLTILPLTVTRRCGKRIVEEARSIVPNYQAHESNHEGLVDRALYTMKKDSLSGKWVERDWKKTYGPLVNPGDMVLCRVNAPLIGQCFKFLNRGIRAGIIGREIGRGLITLIDNSETSTTPEFLKWLGAWREKEFSSEQGKDNPNEQRIMAIEDKYDCLLTFCEGATNLDEVKRRINNLFTDDKNLPGVRFSSIHKSKGLEARHVFILEPEGTHVKAKMAWQQQQERNLRYVAITRAIEELTYVS